MMVCILVYGAMLVILIVTDTDVQVFSSRQPRKNTSHKGSGEICDSFGHRERRDSHRDRDQRSDQQQGTSRVYTPAQFENSLGKLQVLHIQVIF